MSVKKLCYLLFVAATIILYSFLANGAKNSYPKTREDRHLEKMGSILGKDGLVFRQSGTQTSAVFSEKECLWQAAIQILSFAPLASVDSNIGIIITDWFVDTINNSNLKLVVLIKGNAISADTIDVTVYQRIYKDERWFEKKISSYPSSDIIDKILTKARDLCNRDKEGEFEE